MFSDNRLLIYLGVFVVTGAIAATTEIPLPDGVQKVTTVEDRIEHCDISGHGGRFGASFLFVGMRLSNLDVPYLRWNTEKSKRSEIETMCNKRQLVNITYLAKRKLVRPQVTYWIETIKIIPIPAT